MHLDYRLCIIGHADSRSTKEYNQHPSLRRAETVKRSTSPTGVEPARIITEGRGPEHHEGRPGAQPPRRVSV